jgi:hypothetical protein
MRQEIQLLDKLDLLWRLWVMISNEQRLLESMGGRSGS